jgi:hypothetical protein
MGTLSRVAPGWADARAESTPVKVLYVGGYSRSGSTLLTRVLGEAPNTVCVGETRYLWSRGLLDNVECGCGAPFRSCPFWSAIGDDAFGGWNQVDAEQLTAIDRALNRLGALPLYAMPRLPSALDRTISDYAACLASLYAAISRVSGAKMIIEMSKDPTFACLLMRAPGSDVRVIHLVRDSRAVAYSWTRTRSLSSPINGHQFMPRFRPSETAVKWVAWNGAFHALSMGRRPYLKLTYESFITEPRAVLQQLSAFADEALVPSEAEFRDGKIKLGGHHIFSGNPMRSTTGWLPLRLDSEWQTKLSTAQLAKVTGITWPLLRHYGYPTNPPARKNGDELVTERAD